MTDLKSDVFSAFNHSDIQSKFDIIAANLYFPVQGQKAREGALESYNSFFKNFHTFLKPDGRAMLTSGDFADVAATCTLMNENGITPNVHTTCRSHFNGAVDMNWYVYTFDRNGEKASTLVFTP